MGHAQLGDHGRPTGNNAHPYATDRLVVVHNGIMENFRRISRSGKVERQRAGAKLCDQQHRGQIMPPNRDAQARPDRASGRQTMYLETRELGLARHVQQRGARTCSLATVAGEIGASLAAVVPDIGGRRILLNDRILCVSFGAVAAVVRSLYVAQPVPLSWSVETALA